jgi:hypothetical protein
MSKQTKSQWDFGALIVRREVWVTGRSALSQFGRAALPRRPK